MLAVIDFLQSYSRILTGAAIGILALILVVFLAKILKQIKRLNRSLSSVTGNIQEYFDTILDDTPEVKMAQETIKITKEERDMLLSESVHKAPNTQNTHKKEEDEKVFNAVLQEYFS